MVFFVKNSGKVYKIQNVKIKAKNAIKNRLCISILFNIKQYHYPSYRYVSMQLEFKKNKRADKK